MLNVSRVLWMRCGSCPRSQSSLGSEDPSLAPRPGRFPMEPFRSSLPAATPDSPRMTSWLSPVEPPAHPCSPRSAYATLPSLLEAGLQGQQPHPAALQLRGLRHPYQSRPQSARFIPPQCHQEDYLRAQKAAVLSDPVHSEPSRLTGSESVSRSAFQWPLPASGAFALFLLSNHTVFVKQIRLLASASFPH